MYTTQRQQQPQLYVAAATIDVYYQTTYSAFRYNFSGCTSFVCSSFVDESHVFRITSQFCTRHLLFVYSFYFFHSSFLPCHRCCLQLSPVCLRLAQFSPSFSVNKLDKQCSNCTMMPIIIIIKIIKRKSENMHNKSSPNTINQDFRSSRQKVNCTFIICGCLAQQCGSIITACSKETIYTVRKHIDNGRITVTLFCERQKNR